MAATGSIPVALACGLGIFVVTHRGARRYLSLVAETAAFRSDDGAAFSEGAHLCVLQVSLSFSSSRGLRRRAGRRAAGHQTDRARRQNFAKLETTVACGGATTPEAVPEMKKMGFASIINLRLPTEAGANVEGEAAAAKTAGINFFNIPFSGQSPDPKVADQFLATITDAGQRAGVHPLRRRQPRRRDVDDQAARRRSLGHRHARTPKRPRSG